MSRSPAKAEFIPASMVTLQSEGVCLRTPVDGRCRAAVRGPNPLDPSPHGLFEMLRVFHQAR